MTWMALAAAAALAAAGAAPAAAQQGQGPGAPGGGVPAYASALPTAYPQAYTEWRAELPARYRREPWASRFSGKEPPIRQVSVQGRPALFLSSCRPNRCASGIAVALMTPDQAHIVGLIHTSRRIVRVGDPSPKQVSCMNRLWRHENQRDCP